MDLRCTQCGATVSVAADARLLECPFCATPLAVGAGDTLFHEVILATLDGRAAAAHLRRFLAGPSTAAGADREARLSDPTLEYFPFWAFTVGGGGDERVLLLPAAPSSLRGLQGLQLATGDSRPMRAELVGDATVIEPEVPVATAREWLGHREGDVAVTRTALYHVPLFRLDYEWRGRRWHAAVEAVSGAVLTADYPAKAETPYALVAALAVAVFGIEGLIFSNLAVKAVVYLLSAVPLVAVAWLVTRKV